MTPAQRTPPPEAEAARAIGMVAEMLESEPVAAGRSERIAHQLERAISVGVLDVGVRLPNETELSERLGVSSITLRQALAQLRTKRLIETRRGRSGGSFVSGHRPSQHELRAQLREWDPVRLRELTDLVSVTADGVARLAARRSDDDDLDRVRMFAADVRTSKDPAAARRSDARFHIALGVASHSGRMANLVLRLQSELSELSWLSPWSPRDLEQHADEHDAIVRAVARRDADEAARLAREHHEAQCRGILDELLRAQHAAEGDPP